MILAPGQELFDSINPTHEPLITMEYIEVHFSAAIEPAAIVNTPVAVVRERQGYDDNPGEG